jgi:hypothetical protein
MCLWRTATAYCVWNQHQRTRLKAIRLETWVFMQGLGSCVNVFHKCVYVIACMSACVSARRGCGKESNPAPKHTSAHLILHTETNFRTTHSPLPQNALGGSLDQDFRSNHPHLHTPNCEYISPSCHATDVTLLDLNEHQGMNVHAAQNDVRLPVAKSASRAHAQAHTSSKFMSSK